MHIHSLKAYKHTPLTHTHKHSQTNKYTQTYKHTHTCTCTLTYTHTHNNMHIFSCWSWIGYTILYTMQGYKSY